MSRPTAIGVEFEIDSLEMADAALHELGWLLHEKEKIEAAAKQAIEDLKETFAARQSLVIDKGAPPTTIAERIAALKEKLEEFTTASIKDHLKGKKSLRLSHGELGLRQQPRVVEPDVDPESREKYEVEAILNWIRESDLSNSQKKALTETKTTLHLKGAKDAFEGGKITRESLMAVGLVVREACNAAVIKPAKIAVSAEA